MRPRVVPEKIIEKTVAVIHQKTEIVPSVMTKDPVTKDQMHLIIHNVDNPKDDFEVVAAVLFGKIQTKFRVMLDLLTIMVSVKSKGKLVNGQRDSRQMNGMVGKVRLADQIFEAYQNTKGMQNHLEMQKQLIRLCMQKTSRMF